MLDKDYDLVSARNALEQSAIERCGAAEEDDRLAAMFRGSNTFSDKFTIQELENPSSWRLLKRNNGSEMEEAVFTVQGIIISKDLPPIYEKPRIPVHRLKYLRQSISLTGGGSATFSSALDAVQVIYRQFDRRFPEGVLDAWSTDSTLDSLDISNRYFTPLKNVSGLENVAFHKGVDPRNILRDMAKSDHIHTEDNYVAYFSMHKDINGQKKFESCEPQIFRVGDIVQAQLSFVVIPVKAGQRKMLTVLRSLALLDETFTITSGERAVKTLSTLPTLKRKVGYNDTEAGTREERNEKRDKMEIDQVREALED